MTKKIEETNNSNGKYGFISMVAMIIGIVVASGIFVKNSEIIIGTNSAILTTIAWIIGGLIVICMMMGFLEITSSSRLKNEQGTILNWSRNFLGKNAAMIIGYYITFLYIPLLTIGLSFFAANFLFQALGVDLSLIWGFIFITVIGIFLMSLVQVINGLTSKPGKIFQTTGTFIKMIPLFAIIIIAIAVIAGSINTVDPNAVFDPDSSINEGINKSTSAGNYIALIFAVLPGILFSFDGFLYADSLSLEAKKETTYKKALIFSIIFIIIIYIIFSLSTMALAEANTDGSFANDAFNTTIIFDNVFPNYPSIGTILVLLIMISVLVAVNGLSTVSSRNLADASHQNLIKDENGVLLRRNRSEAPYNAAFKIFIFMIIFAVILRAGDAIMIDWKNSENYANGKDLQLTGIATNLAAVFMFFMYGLILVGGVINRFTKKVEVQKSFGFIFFAIIAMFFMIASSGFFLWDTFLQDIVWVAKGQIPTNALENNVTLRSTSKELIAMVFFLTVLISMWIGIIVYNNNHIKEANFANYPNKINTRKTYDALISYKDYEKVVFSNSDFSTLINNPEKLDYEWYLNQQTILEQKINYEKEKLHIRSFLPIKLQEKFPKEKTNKEEFVQNRILKEKIETLFTSWKYIKIDLINQNNNNLQLDENDIKILKRSFIIRNEIIRNELEQRKKLYKTNKEIFKDASNAEKESVQAKKEKYIADLNLGTIKIEKSFNDLKSNLLTKGIDFDFKSSKSELQKIAQEYLSLSSEQLDSKFRKYGIKVKAIETKGQKYNLLKQFEKTTIKKLKAELNHYKISYKEEAKKGELFSLLKNNK